MSTVNWRSWLCNSSDMSQIAEINAHDRQLQLQLNSGGKATCWLDLLDPTAALVVEHQTALRLDRNGQTVWSGPIYSTEDDSSTATGTAQGVDKKTITAMGWFENLNHRIIHTGAEFQTMLAGSYGAAWQAAYGSYSCPGIDTATQLAYSASQFPTTTDAVIMADLLNRANIDSPTSISMGNVYGVPMQRNLTLQRFQNVGQQLTQLANVEAGCDIYVDPVSRTMNLYGPAASSSPTVPNGMGIDRGPGVVFTYPGNCTAVKRTRDGTLTINRVEASGQYGVGRADDIDSQQSNGLLEENVQLSEVVDPNILIAYANSEVAVRKQPWTIITFTPRGLTASDSITSGVPRPFDDFFIGDVVYCNINRGCIQVGSTSANPTASPQATRVFGFTVSIADDGVEKLSQIQTTYQSLAGS